MEKTNPIFIGSEITDCEILKSVPEDYQELLKQRNGFILFDGGLHIRGAVLSPEWHSLRKVWSGDFALHNLYPAINATDVPFAQDCLGDQFLLRKGEVFKLNAVVGEIKNLNMDLKTFISRSEENPIDFLLLQPLQQHQNEGGRLQPGELLSVYPPYCTKESENGVTLKAIPMFDCIGNLANFARQIANVPNGVIVEVMVENIPDSKI